jgi:hypothetical protein
MPRLVGGGLGGADGGDLVCVASRIISDSPFARLVTVAFIARSVSRPPSSTERVREPDWAS